LLQNAGKSGREKDKNLWEIFTKNIAFLFALCYILLLKVKEIR